MKEEVKNATVEIEVDLDTGQEADLNDLSWITEEVVDENISYFSVGKISEMENALWDKLLGVYGHSLEVGVYGDMDDPDNVSLEDMDEYSVRLDAELYTVMPRGSVRELAQLYRMVKRLMGEVKALQAESETLKGLLRGALDELYCGAEEEYAEELLDILGTSEEELKKLGVRD